MTERLYYQDSHLTEFTARVLSCTPEADGTYLVVLDRTAFYPEGGGQPADRGRLGTAEVLDVQTKGTEILHRVNTPLEIGMCVEGNVDWQRRLNLMQQHSGEHIVSGLIHGRYGYENVGFHMGSETVTIDFSDELTLEQLREIEYEANRLIWADIPVEIGFYRGAELDGLSYRSKKALTGDVRIVTFPGADVCACCGTHVKRTGEIGCVRIISVQKLRSGVRAEMVSGERCYRYFDSTANENHGVSVALSVPEQKTSDGLMRLLEEHRQLKYRTAGLEARLFAAMAAECSGPSLIFEPELDADGIRRLCTAVLEHTGQFTAVFSGKDEQGYKYAVGQPEGDIRTLVRELNSALAGRGGGKPAFAQGSVRADRQTIRAFFARQGIFEQGDR